jgi:hypothetical protein
VKCFTEMTCVEVRVEVRATVVPDGLDNGLEGAGISQGRAGSSEDSRDGGERDGGGVNRETDEGMRGQVVGEVSKGHRELISG